MISTRVSNRSSLASRITKSQISIKKFISSSQYLQTCKANDQKPQEILYDSLLNYEKQISLLKGSLLIAEAKNNHHRKQTTFWKVHEFALKAPLPVEPLSEEEESYIKLTYLTDKAKECQQLAELLEERQQNQRRAQEEFLKAITQQYQEDNLKSLEASVNIERILNRKVFKAQQLAFTEIHRKAFPQKPSLNTIKNVLTSSFMMVNIKMKQTKQNVFRTLLKQFGLDSIVDQIDANMKLKGRALMALKQYPRLNLKRAFWRWYLSSTDNGDKLFQNAADKLVLYTNINKTTFFYRLLNKVKVRQIKVDPKVKRMAVMFYLYTKIYYERPQREFFEKFKIVTSKKEEEQTLSYNIVKCAQLREKDLFKKWMKSVKEHKQKETIKKKMYDGFAKRLIEVSNQKKKWLLEEWKILAEKQAKNNEIKSTLLKKIVMKKAQKVMKAFRLMRQLPGKKTFNFNLLKILKFEKGLANFAQRTLKRALDSFRNQFEEGQAQKKRAAIQLIQCTQGSQKKMFNRWKLLLKKTKLMDECRQMNNLFQTLSFIVKSTADIVFVQNNEAFLKEKTLLQLFKNLSGNVSDTFRRWREINTISKLRDSVSQKQKEMVLKVLDGLLRNSKTAQIRDAIAKFRINRRVTEIQRSFLKKLLMSKAGMIVIAFRKMQSLPERSNIEAFKKASKFEKGLANFAQRTLKRALDSFRNQFEEGQAQKKRAAIQLIQCTQGSQKKMFNRWINEVQSHKLYMRCQLLQRFFDNSFLALNRNFSLLYQARSYSLQSVQKLHKYFSKINSSTNESILHILDQLKKNSMQRRVNKWFYKAAVTFAVRTKVNMQKSLWRLKLNAYTNGVLYDASLMVKLKKMYNNIRKYYELNLFRAFLMIDKYGKTVQNLENSQTISRHTSDYVRIQGSFREESNLFESSSNIEMESFKQDQIFLASRKAAVSICENIFNYQTSQQLKRWKYNAQPHKKYEQMNQQLLISLPDTYVFLNQSKAVSLVMEKIRCKKLRDLAWGFRTLIQYGHRTKKETQFDQNVEQRIELITRQNKLMEEVKDYQKDNQQLLQQIQEKESLLNEANQAVAVLSLRINFMITSQFIGLVEKVIDSVNWRHFNQGFDGVIQKANQNFQLEQSQQIYEEEQNEG